MRPSLLLVLTLTTPVATGEGPLTPKDVPAELLPRRFGLPGGIGPTRGWYIWRRFDATRWVAEVAHEGTGEKFTVKVLPWATTYRHLVYGAHPDELLPGERVNTFFAPDQTQRRGYLVHFQDELGQMKGHGHAWEVRGVTPDGFTARVLAGAKPLDDKVLSFHIDAAARHWRGGKMTKASVQSGARLYMTWCYQDGRKVVHLTADDESLDAVKKAEHDAVTARLAKDGLGAHVEAVEGTSADLLVFPTFWSQASQWKQDQAVEIRGEGTGISGKLKSRKNLGTYGSGATAIRIQLDSAADAGRLRDWIGKHTVRVRYIVTR